MLVGLCNNHVLHKFLRIVFQIVGVFQLFLIKMLFLIKSESNSFESNYLKSTVCFVTGRLSTLPMAKYTSLLFLLQFFLVLKQISFVKVFNFSLLRLLLIGVSFAL